MNLLVMKKIFSFGRGIGAGFQFKFFEYYTLDIIGGITHKILIQKLNLLKVKNS